MGNAEPRSSPDVGRDRLASWLSEIGPRWGLPADACRVHGYLYLLARPVAAAELAAAARLPAGAVSGALEWLRTSGLAEEVGPALWRTESDPWALVTAALEARRAAELGPALEVLRASRRDAAGDDVLTRQIGRLLDLVEDVAAIDAQAKRMSPALFRALLTAGGRFARLLGGPGGARR